MKQETFENIVRFLILIFAVKIVTKLLQGLQIFDTEADRLEAEAKNDFLRGASSPTFGILFNPDAYWRKLVEENNIYATQITQRVNAQKWKEEVYKTKGFFNDDEAKLFSLFGQLQNFDDLVWCSFYFQYMDQDGSDTAYMLGTSLGSFLSEYIDEEDMYNLAIVINNMQKGVYKYPSLQPNL